MIFLGWDIAYNENRLLQKRFSATIKSHKKNMASCQQVIELAKRKSIILLPSHDPDNENRLKEEKVLAFSNRGI